MKRSNLVQPAVVLAGAAVMVLFVLWERVADWVSPPHFEARTAATEADDPWVYVCPMDGFQRSDPGPCAVPACGGMPLTDEHKIRKSQLHRSRQLSLSSDMLRRIDLGTEPVEEREIVKHLRTVGRISPDERLTRVIAARVEGRLEHVYKNFVGAEVAAGEPLAEVYSPDVLSTQEELLIARRSGDARSAEAARKRLLLWGFKEEQVAEIEKEGKARTRLTWPAPVSGVVSRLSTHHGHWVKEGDEVMEVVDLSSVWLQADVYEYEIPFLQLEQKVEVTSPAFPGETFQGRISYIHAFLDEKTRTLHLRVDLPNPGRRLLPGRFVDAHVHVPLGPGGSPVGPTGEIETDEFFCHIHGPADNPSKCPKCDGPMDVRKVRKKMGQEETVWVCGTCCPDVREKKPGKCPKCPMVLKEKKELPMPRTLAVPRGAVLDGGLKQYVFVEAEPNAFRRTEVTLGPRAGDFYPVKKGLKKGDRVVTRAAYLLDSQSQITSGSSALFSGSTEVREEKGHKH